MVWDMDPDVLQRAFFDAVYTYRLAVALAAGVFAVGAALVAWRLGWFGAARRHPARAGILLVVGLSVALPLGYYVASPLWIRSELIEPETVAIADPTSTPISSPAPAGSAMPGQSAATPRSEVSASVTPSTPPTVIARRLASGSFHGTDDFHFGRGTATIIETAPGTYSLRLEAFSVRNGPDLYVYLSPSAHDYVKGAVEVGRLKATDGTFAYALPAGTDPADFASAIIWCKQFSHLFAVAPLEAI
jgi:Electron transfer DM13